jgi:PAS domain S-box-containing protein
MLWISGRDGNCTSFNQRWLEFTGRPLELEVGDGWAGGVHPEDFQRCMTIYFDAFVARRDFRMEYRLRRADGAYRWILDTGLPRFGPNQVFAGFIGSCIDITDFREAHEALRRLTEQLEGSVKEARAAISARDEFLSIASHELRTPLSALVLQLAALQRLLQAQVDGSDAS